MARTARAEVALARSGAAATRRGPAEWHDLFVALAGVSAVLAGLRFVAVSIRELPEGAKRPAAWRTDCLVIRLSGADLPVIGALSEVLAFGGSLCWIAAGFAFLTVRAVAGAGVLVIEILR